MWMSFKERYARVGGRVSWSANAAPQFVKFDGSWPIIALRLTGDWNVDQLQTRVQARKSSWHAHVPRGGLGVPRGFRLSAQDSRSLVRRDGTIYVFDFTGMGPLPSNDLERRLGVLLDEVEAFRRYHPEVLDRLGIEIRIIFRDDDDTF